MDKQTFLNLLEKYLNGNASIEEQEFLHAYYDLFLADSEVIELLSKNEKQKLEAEIKAHIDANLFPNPKRISLWIKLGAVAASIAIAVLAGVYFYQSNFKQATQQVVSNDINPGKVAATLTLSNGKKIYVADIKTGNVAEETGVKITKNEKGELVYTIIDNQNEPGKMQTLTTYRGETQALVLPDGSEVWLNAASSIKYPSSFVAASNRKVELTGEAYFEIAKDKSRPFIVSTDKQEVEVLGTHFNINSYSDELTTKTTLLEGSVRVSDKATNEEMILEPGMQSRLSKNKLTVSEVDVDDAIAWKEGFFVFSNEPLGDIMKQVARWYNVEIEYKDDELRNKKFSGSVSRYAKVSQVLKKLELTKSVVFRIEGQKIITERKTK